MLPRHNIPSPVNKIADVSTHTTAFFDKKNKTFNLQPLPEVMENITPWNAADTNISLANSSGYGYLAGFVTQLELNRYVSFILDTEDVDIAKPHPFPVFKTLDHFNIATEDSLVVDDMRFEILMAKRAGCHTCGVTYNNGTEEELREAGASFITDSFLNIPS